MIMGEAEFGARAIHAIMAYVFPGLKFHMVGHSMGGVINLNMTMHPKFPLAALATMVSLSSPIGVSPQALKRELPDYFNEINTIFKPHEDVLHVNVKGGSRDILVQTNVERQSFSRFEVNVATPFMNNVFHAIDHNSPYFHKPFLDAFVPAALYAFITADDPIQERYETVKDKLQFNSNFGLKDIGKA